MTAEADTAGGPADIIIRNGTCIVEGGLEPQPLDIGIAGGRIIALGAPKRLAPGGTVIDAQGQYVVPGLIDTHVHTRAPGFEYKEDFVTCSAAAAAGGITMFLAMFNVRPPTTSPANCEALIRHGEAHSLVNFNLYGLVTEENIGEIPGMASLGIASFKCLMGYKYDDAGRGFSCPSDGAMLDAMGSIASTGVPLSAHAENDEIIRHRRDLLRSAGRRDPLSHLESRPAVAEAEAIARLILYSRHVSNKLHLLHVSSRDGLDIIMRAKQDRLPVTAETCPHYLLMTHARHVSAYGSLAKINPPIRDQCDQDALWQGVQTGAIDVIGTDHAPHTDEEKMIGHQHEDMWRALSGFAGVETSIPLLLTEVHRGRLSMSKLVQICSTNAARIFGFYPDRGTLRVGSAADVAIIDPDHEWVIDRRRLHSRSTATPFHGWRVRGKARHVIVNGTLVLTDGAISGRPGVGRFVAARHTAL